MKLILIDLQDTTKQRVIEEGKPEAFLTVLAEKLIKYNADAAKLTGKVIRYAYRIVKD